MRKMDWGKLVYAKPLLVGGLQHEFYFCIQLGMMRMPSSQLTNSYFSEGWLNHQPDCDLQIFLANQVRNEKSEKSTM